MTGTIPRSFIDDLIARVDIIDLIDSYVPLKRTGRNYSACCPFHQEKTPSFNVSSSKQFYHCFGCGVSGNVISFMIAYRQLDFREAIEELASRVGLVVPYENSGKTAPVPQFSQDLYTLLSQVTQFYQQKLLQSPLGAHAREYIQKRGLSDSIMETYQLGYAPAGWENLKESFGRFEKELIATGLLVERSMQRVGVDSTFEGRRNSDADRVEGMDARSFKSTVNTRTRSGTYDQYRDRIMFPIHDRRGRIIGFGGRVLDDKQMPKYINSPETTLFHKSKALYGLYQASKNNPQPDYLFIVEGYMDVIAMAQQGITQVVAALGTATTRDHIQSLLRYTKQLIFCFDGDNAGRKAAWKALESALPYLDAQAHFLFIFLPDGEDPDSLIRREGRDIFLQRIQQAKALDVFFFEELTQTLDLSQMADCGKLVQSTKSYFTLMPDCAYRELMLEQLARLARINPASIEKQFREERTYQNLPEQQRNQNQKSNVQTVTGIRTNVRIALSLLIQHPELIKVITEIKPIAELSVLSSIKGGKMLYDLMTAIHQETIRSTGQLIEYYRDQSYFPWITQLAVFSHNVPSDGLEAEFIGAIKMLQQEVIDKQITSMLQHKQTTDFSVDERRALLAMIQKNKMQKPS